MVSGSGSHRDFRADIIGFHESIVKEIYDTRNRVRSLIGDASRPDEGRYKEVVLRRVLRRFLPSDVSVGTGFIVKSSEQDGRVDVSRQIDILVYRNTVPVLFREGDFVITAPSNVLGVIEVKTRVNTSILGRALRQAEDIGKFLGRENVFVGVFSYENDIPDRSIMEANESFDRKFQGKRYVNHVVLNEQVFIKRWSRSDVESNWFLSEPECSGGRSTGYKYFYRIYRFDWPLAPSYFISNLVYQASGSKVSGMNWFFFPLPGTKESFRVRDICV